MVKSVFLNHWHYMDNTAIHEFDWAQDLRVSVVSSKGVIVYSTIYHVEMAMDFGSQAKNNASLIVP